MRNQQHELIVANVTATADSLARLAALVGRISTEVVWSVDTDAEYTAFPPGEPAECQLVTTTGAAVYFTRSKRIVVEVPGGSCVISVVLARPATGEELAAEVGPMLGAQLAGAGVAS